MEINIEINNTAKNPVDENLIRNIAQTVIGQENKRKSGTAGISIAFIGPGIIRKISKKYRGIDCTTDALSFAEKDFAKNTAAGCLAEADFLGELLICLQQVRRDADQMSVDFKRELAWVLIHGILHLFGYDHEKDEKEARRMRAKEQFYLSRLVLNQ